MIGDLPTPPGFWRVVRILLAAARYRAAGRRKRQQELLNQRAGRGATDWGGLGLAVVVLAMGALNIFAAICLRTAVEAGQRAEAEHQGKIVVSSQFLDTVRRAEGENQPNLVIDSSLSDETKTKIQEAVSEAWLKSIDYASEARRMADSYGGSKEVIEQRLRDTVHNHGARDLIAERDAAAGLAALATHGRFPAMLGSAVLLWWLVMLAMQGEGVELDIQRRRHPMWEWLFSHPIPAGAVFFAEMVSPMAANPVYWGGPLFAGLVYAFAYGPMYGLLAAFLVGVPITIAAACMGKALEVAVVLRFPARSRGAMIGLMGWVGYASLLLFFVGFYAVPRMVSATAGFLLPFASLPWPWLGWFLGAQDDGTFLFPAGVAACFLFSAGATAASVWFSVWGAQRGLSGNLGQAGSAPSVSLAKPTRFGKEPLYRKEFLWFIRDRSAIVQSILIPLTVAAFQLFNLRIVLNMAQGAWNYLCGAAILFGTYFLWVLGPKSLASEGSALWIAMTWPRGLESLLKAKAWLWSLISTAMVAIVLCYAVFVFPAYAWQIALVGIGWFFFSRSMAEKAVTLVTITSESGEQQKIPWGRRVAAQLGMMTFAIGILTRQWHLAINGIVFSYLTAAAMWQNFRARLPYLYDPWSEELPPAPSLMHAMISISILVELAAMLAGMLSAALGREYFGIALAFSYAIAAIVVCVGTSMFLSARNVELSDVLNWNQSCTDKMSAADWWRGGSNGVHLMRLILLGVVCGVSLGLLARGYVALLHFIPSIVELMRKSQEEMKSLPDLRLSYTVMAVAFAPFAEEYLFRGLLYRALDREWGGWRAVFGSAAFFAIYHPALAWLPVFSLGAVNALLFKKTGRLAPAIILHMVYNAVVSA